MDSARPIAPSPPVLDGELLRAFVAFAETRNFTLAARRVGLSQPALFERVRRLGDLLSLTLYRREGRALVLTEQGVRLAAFAREQLASAEGFVRSLHGLHDGEEVTLAAGEGSYLYLLGPVLSRFVEDGSAILSLRTLGGPSACAAVLSGEADLAVAVVDLVPRGLLARDLVSAPLCAAVSSKHPLARRKSARLSDLADERLILPPAGRMHRDLVGRAVAGSGAPVGPPLEADGWPLMLAFARAGLGVAVVNGVCAPPEGVALVPVPELGTVTYRLLSRRDAVAGAAASRLTTMILGLRGCIGR